MSKEEFQRKINLFVKRLESPHPTFGATHTKTTNFSHNESMNLVNWEAKDGAKFSAWNAVHSDAIYLRVGNADAGRAYGIESL